MEKLTINDSKPETYAVIIPKIGAILDELVIGGNSAISCPVFDNDYQIGKPRHFYSLFPIVSKTVNILLRAKAT